MLEVVFNQNTKAVIRMAKEYNAENMLTGTITILGKSL